MSSRIMKAATQIRCTLPRMFTTPSSTGSSKLAKTGATVPVMDNNFFFNVGESFFKEGTSAITQDVATGNGGAVLTADPCTDSAAFNLKVSDASVKAAGAGDPRWL